MTILYWLLLLILGSFFFSFTIWRKLREDYEQKKIYTLTLVIFILSLTGWWIGNHFLVGFAIWVVILANVLFTSFVVSKLEMKFFELIDGLAPAIFYFLFFWYLATLVLDFQNRFFTVGPQIVLAAFSIAIYKILFANYRRFVWYPSGKVGFAGLVSLAFYLVARGLLTLYQGLTAFSASDIINILRVGSITLAFRASIINAIISLALSAVLIWRVYLRSK